MHFDSNYSGKIPIKVLSKNEQQYFKTIVDRLLELNRKRELDGKLTDRVRELKEEIELLENKLDSQVYKIYQITEEEKKVIEKSLK